MERVKAFLKRKQVVISVQTYLIDALGAMAFGLFASLLIGTIFGTLGEKTGVVITPVFLRFISFQTHESSPPCGNKGKTESSLGSMSGDKPRRLY